MLKLMMMSNADIEKFARRAHGRHRYRMADIMDSDAVWVP